MAEQKVWLMSAEIVWASCHTVICFYMSLLNIIIHVSVSFFET